MEGIFSRFLKVNSAVLVLNDPAPPHPGIWGLAHYFRITCVVLDKNRPESNLFYICISVFICKMSRREKHQTAFIPSLYSHVFSSIFSLIDAKGKSTMPSWLSAFRSKKKKNNNPVSAVAVSLGLLSFWNIYKVFFYVSSSFLSSYRLRPWLAVDLNMEMKIWNRGEGACCWSHMWRSSSHKKIPHKCRLAVIHSQHRSNRKESAEIQQRLCAKNLSTSALFAISCTQPTKQLVDNTRQAVCLSLLQQMLIQTKAFARTSHVWST